MTIAKYNLFFDDLILCFFSEDRIPHGYLLGLSATRTDDDIILREIEAPECEWSQYTSKLVVIPKKWNFLDPTRMDPMSLQHRMFQCTDARIDICMGKYLEKMREYELSSSEVDEPVTDDGDAFRLRIYHNFFMLVLNISLYSNKIFLYISSAGVLSPHKLIFILEFQLMTKNHKYFHST